MKKTISILGLKVPLKFFDDTRDEEKMLMGYMSKMPFEIYINKDLPKKDQEHTYAHECCHVILARVGLDQVLSKEVQEVICESFGTFMYENMKFK